MNKDIIMQALKLVIMVITLIITRYAIPYLKAKTDAEKTDKLLKYVREAVRAAEQIFDQKDSRTKKKYVMHYVGRILEQMSIPLTEEELELLVEAAVRTMNAEECLVLSAEEYDDEPDDADETDPSVADK